MKKLSLKPTLEIAHMKSRFPIIQGGMGIKVSLSGLASAVANAGGIGTISGTGISKEELRAQIRKARKLTKGIGYVGVNVLFAMKEFAENMKIALEEKVDFIISGAGISRDMYSWGKEYGVPVISIVSSARLARLSERLGAAAVVVEGKEAGGHLGTDRPLFELLPKVRKAVKIPVIAAGGILTGKDIAKALQLGANGVQMGTRFVASEECDAHPNFKECYIKGNKEDALLVETTVGLQGRALRNKFVHTLLTNKKLKIDKCTLCLKKCSFRFCTRDSLIKAVEGDVENGLVFCGARVGEIKEILPVKKIIQRLMQEYRDTVQEKNLSIKYT